MAKTMLMVVCLRVTAPASRTQVDDVKFRPLLLSFAPMAEATLAMSAKVTFCFLVKRNASGAASMVERTRGTMDTIGGAIAQKRPMRRAGRIVGLFAPLLLLRRRFSLLLKTRLKMFIRFCAKLGALALTAASARILGAS